MDKKSMLNAIKSHYNIKTDTDFAKILSISTQNLNNWYNRQTFDINNLFEKFNDLNPEWLITGEGEMLRTDKAPPAPAPAQEIVSVPMIPIYALAGFGGGGDYHIMERDLEQYTLPSDFIPLKPDCLIRVQGISMYPKYNSGDVLAIKKIEDINVIQWNKPHVLDTKHDIMVKRIQKGDKAGYWSLVSDNAKYSPIDMPVRDVRSVWRVLGAIRIE